MVGVDMSPYGLAALSWDAEEVAARDGQLTLCHARHDGDPYGATPDLDTLLLTEPDLVRHIRPVPTGVRGELPGGGS